MSLNSQVVNLGILVIGMILFVILQFTELILFISGQYVHFPNRVQTQGISLMGALVAGG